MTWRIALALIGLATAALAADSASLPRPNVVFIVSDDQAWTDFGFMGHPHIQTPRLDRLAGQSRTFRRGYVPTSLCCPSLASLLSGKYPHITKVTGNEPPRPKGTDGQPLAKAYQNPGFLAQVRELNGFLGQHPLLPSELGKAGYLSLQTGKWWAGHFSTGGFTEGMSHGDNARGGRHGDEGLKIGRQTMQPIFDFMDRTVGKPFFLWYAPMMPHDPHTPPERLLAKYRDKSPSLHVAKYWAMCEWFDETCGQLLDYLDQKDLAKNTIVVFLVDNGWIQNPDNTRFRPDSKLSQYDAGLRTPIMIRWPGKVPAGFDDKTPVSTIDLATTIYSLLKLPIPPGLPGVDLTTDAAAKRNAVQGACFLHNAVDIHQPARNLTYRWGVSGEWKLILPNAANVTKENKPGRGLGPELYHLTADPAEEKNLAADQPEKVQELTAQLDAWWKP